MAKKNAKVSEPQQPRKIVNSPRPHVSVIIPVLNEIRTLPAVIRHARNVHPQTEVIVVANGSTDGSRKLAERMGAKVLFFRRALGHDVGRSVGANAAKGKVLLFTDADIVIPARDLRKLVKAVERGTDIALNKYLGPIRKKHVHSVILAKHALNAMLSLGSLKGASLTTIPHAISRKALEAIGADTLAIPPKAQAKAALEGLKIRAVHYMDVGKPNPIRRKGKAGDPVKDLIVGDHLEAIDCLLRRNGPRGNFSDLGRLRGMVKD